MSVFLWGVLPYLTALLLIGGLWYRRRFDQFGWTSRSSEIYEKSILKIASPLFHYALFAVLGGHLVGLLIPKEWTYKMGISQHNYHLMALVVGGIAGVACVLALFALIIRRRTNPSVFAATTWNDKGMYVVLTAALVLGLVATFFGGERPNGEEVNYRDTVSVWFRSLFTFKPNIAAMEAATLPFKIHVVVGLLLFCILPLTRLVHAFAAPVQYLFRPYIVYRSRGTRPVQGSSWQTVGQKRTR